LAIEWLDNLESTVRDAVARLDELKEENASLRDRVRHLETEAATAALAPALPFDDEGQDEETEALRAQVRALEEKLAAAETEREEVRRRVEKLTERLTGLAES
jgi:chromosome segregation ATPase